MVNKLALTGIAALSTILLSSCTILNKDISSRLQTPPIQTSVQENFDRFKQIQPQLEQYGGVTYCGNPEDAEKIVVLVQETPSNTGQDIKDELDKWGYTEYFNESKAEITNIFKILGDSFPISVIYSRMLTSDRADTFNSGKHTLNNYALDLTQESATLNYATKNRIKVKGINPDNDYNEILKFQRKYEELDQLPKGKEKTKAIDDLRNETVNHHNQICGVSAVTSYANDPGTFIVGDYYHGMLLGEKNCVGPHQGYNYPGINSFVENPTDANILYVYITPKGVDKIAKKIYEMQEFKN